MFVLSSLEDTVPVAPRDLARPLLDSVADALRARYLDRVVPGLGLAVALYALDAVVGGGGRLYPAMGTAGGGAGGDASSGGAGGQGGTAPAPPGAAYYTARFRLAFFRPFAGEVLVGTLVEATRWGGLRVAIGGGAGGGLGAAAGPPPLLPPLPPPPSSGGGGAASASAAAAAAAASAALTAAAQQRLSDAIFRDVIVRPTDMPPKSSWDPMERSWVWSYEDGTPFVMDVGGRVRVRVHGVRFPSPPTPAERRAAQQQAQAQQMQMQQQQQAQQQQQQQQGGDGGSLQQRQQPSLSPLSWADAEAPPPVGSSANPFAPMEVLASANGDGLGMVEWWTPEEAGEEEGEEEDDAGAAAAAAGGGAGAGGAGGGEHREEEDDGDQDDDALRPMEA